MYNIPLFTRKGVGEKEETEEINSVNKIESEEGGEEGTKESQIINPESIEVSVELSNLTSDIVNTPDNDRPTLISKENEVEGVTNDTNKA